MRNATEINPRIEPSRVSTQISQHPWMARGAERSPEFLERNRLFLDAYRIPGVPPGGSGAGVNLAGVHRAESLSYLP